MVVWVCEGFEVEGESEDFEKGEKEKRKKKEEGRNPKKSLRIGKKITTVIS